ncbi:Ger(x)C family spore germination protein [Paenibacillus kobensis]|uniref:Ger(x)C family spore germination protein n=1 Tax=Paenibacillus kobensis TaxID=59841 RepID=UPI0013E2C25C|nr:Ger(x)C family spore germination protein [Paenibacillus kobensis]
MARMIGAGFVVKSLILVVLLVPVAGCWSSKELNELAITMGMAIDQYEGNKFLVTVQVVDSGEVSASKGTLGRSPVILYRAKGDTVSEALQRMSTSSPRAIYNSHLRVLVIGETLARKGIKDVLDYISRNWQFRTDFPVIIAKGAQAGDTLRVLTPIESIPAIQMLNAIENSKKYWAPTVAIHFDDLIRAMVSKGRQAVVTGILLTGDAEEGGKRSNLATTLPKSRLRLIGLSAFKKDKLIGWLNENDSRGYNFIMGQVYKSTGNITCDDGKLLALEVLNEKSKLKASFQGGKLRLAADMKVEAKIAEVACDIKLTRDETIRQLEAKAEKRLREIAQSALDRIQHDLKVDVFGYGEVVHRHYPKYWRQVKANWDEQFSNTPVDLQVDVKIRLLGTVTEALERVD